jgi:type 2A phosphatase activator TIP41
MNPEPKVDKYNQNDWSFEFAKSILSPSTEIEAIGKILDLNSTPDVVFGKNFAKLSHKNKPFFFCVDPRDCLFFCNFEARQKYL